MIPQSLPGTYSGGESSRGFGSRLRSACVSRLSAVDPIVLVMWSAVLGAMLAGFVLTGVPVDLAVDGCVEHRQTHQLTVDGLLRETGLALGANDLVSPPPTTRLRRNMRVDVSSARRIVVHVDGGTIEMHTQATLLGDVLTEAGVVLQPHDQIFVAERPISADQLLPAFEATETPATDVCPLRWSSLPVNVAVKRALHVEMYDGNDVTEFFTAQPTVGLALYEQGVPVYVADLVTPSLSETIQEDAKIRIERSFPVTISADGRTRHTRTREKMVGHVLAQAGILLQGKDYVTPGLE